LIHIGKYRAGIGAEYTEHTIRHPFSSIWTWEVPSIGICLLIIYF